MQAQLGVPTPTPERHGISTQTPPCVMLSALDPWVIREQRRERGERLRYPSDETMDSLRTVLEGVVPHINAVLDACSQLPRVSLWAAELRPSAATGPLPSIQASTPRAVQPAAASLAHPAAERPPERRA